MPSRKLIVGVDLGGTNIQIGVMWPDRKLLARAKRKTKPDEGRDAVIGRILDGISEACADCKLKPGGLAAVGVGAPGGIAADSGTGLEAVDTGGGEVARAALG